MSQGLLLTVPEVAEILRVSPSTVRRLIREGALPAVRLGGTKTGYRVMKAEVEELIKRSTVSQQPSETAPAE